MGDAVPDPLPGDVGVEVLGGVPADRALHLDDLDPGAERRGLGSDVLVAGDHRDRDAVVHRDERVDPGLAGGGAVEGDVRDGPRVVGVRQDARRRHRGVVAEEQRDVVRRVESLHHVERLEPPREVRRAPVELGRRQVAHGRVAVVDQDLRGARLACAVDRGVDLTEEEVTPERVVVAAGEALLPVGDAGHALHVRREVDLHEWCRRLVNTTPFSVAPCRRSASSTSTPSGTAARRAAPSRTQCGSLTQSSGTFTVMVARSGSTWWRSPGQSTGLPRLVGPRRSSKSVELSSWDPSTVKTFFGVLIRPANSQAGAALRVRIVTAACFLVKPRSTPTMSSVLFLGRFVALPSVVDTCWTSCAGSWWC